MTADSLILTCTELIHCNFLSSGFRTFDPGALGFSDLINFDRPLEIQI